jgi:fatty-acyl-CoA synthase
VKPLIVDYDDSEFPQSATPLSGLDYEAFVAGGDAGFAWRTPQDEWEAIALNYTSAPQAIPRVSSITTAART